LQVVRRRQVDVVVIVKLDRLARSTHHLLSMAKEFESLGVDLVAIDQAVDTTTPAGRLLFHMLGAIAEFERDLIRERVIAGVRRARALGKHLGRPRVHHSEDSHHETSDSSNRLRHRTSTRRRRMRPAHDARDHDNDAPVIDWSTGRYDVTRSVR
jgi:DNA invertase Pin-like site-specific DNA recombinase